MTDRHTPEQIDAGLKRLDADLSTYLAADVMTDAEVDEAMRGLPEPTTLADRQRKSRVEAIRDSTRAIPEPGDVAVFDGGRIIGYVAPPKMPTFKIGDELTVPATYVADFMNTLPRLAPAVVTTPLSPPEPKSFGVTIDSQAPEPDPLHWLKRSFIERPIKQDFGPPPFIGFDAGGIEPTPWLAERDAPSNWRPPSDSPMAKWLAEEESKMIGRHVALEASEADGRACARDLEAFAAELRGPKIDRRTRLAWAGACLAEAGEQIVEAFKLIFGLWRRYE